MYGNPSAEQKRFHAELRDMYAFTQWKKDGTGELHHIFGSKAKFKLLKEAGIKKEGEWFVVMIPKRDHDMIGGFSFEAERGWFLKQQQDYEEYYGRKSPMPDLVITYYKLLKGKHVGLKSWYASD